MLKFFIVSSGWNCAEYVRKAFESIRSQDYPHFKAIMISDGSTDRTAEELKKIEGLDDRIRIVIAPQNSGAAFHRFYTINHEPGIDSETVIVLFGMDDKLKPFALSEIKKQYDRGKWMSYGNWVNQYGEGLPESFELDFDDETHRARDYRKASYRSTGLNTFKKFLFDEFTEDDFRVKGRWIKATTESNLMISCLEMCGRRRIGIVRRPICIYNMRGRDNARHRMPPGYQDMIYKNMQQRPKRPLYPGA